MCRNIFSKIQS